MLKKKTKKLNKKTKKNPTDMYTYIFYNSDGNRAWFFLVVKLTSLKTCYFINISYHVKSVQFSAVVFDLKAGRQKRR